MSRISAFLLVLLALFLSPACDLFVVDEIPSTPRDDPPADPADTYYVSTDGDDGTGDGSASRPWRTIGHAVNSVSADGGHTILVQSGLYDGPIRIERAFASEVIIKSEEPYGAMLTNVANSEPILLVVLPSGDDGPIHLTIEGFVIANEGTTGGPCTSREGYMIFISNVSNFTFRNNIVYGNNRKPRCNNMVKVGIVGATQPWREMRFEGNVFGNPSAVDGNDLFVVFEPTEFDICDNIFFSNRGGNAGGSFVALRRRWGATTRSPRYRVARNIFLNYEGASDAAFLRIGGWGSPISDALVENNLMIGNSATPMAAPVILEDASEITLRANTVVGNLPSSAFALRLGTDGNGPASENIVAYNNIFSDPTATMGDLVVTHGNANLAGALFLHNLYWNGTGTVPLTNDTDAIEADPLIPNNQGGIVLPVWEHPTGMFASGSRTVREEFERLARTHGVISSGSPARDAAAVDEMPSDDILGFARDSMPDLGALEFGASPSP
jgi:hypothetical protein